MQGIEEIKSEFKNEEEGSEIMTKVTNGTALNYLEDLLDLEGEEDCFFM